MLRLIFPPLRLVAVVSAVVFLAPLNVFSAPPPDSVKYKVFKSISAPYYSKTLVAPLASTKVSLYDRFGPVLISPMPKRIINGRCVVVSQRYVIPPR